MLMSTEPKKGKKDFNFSGCIKYDWLKIVLKDIFKLLTNQYN